MSNYMILSSLTAALIILIRINWGLETGCTCKPSLWPLPGLLSLNWESWSRKSSAPGEQTLPLLTSPASCKQQRGAGHWGSSSERDWNVVGEWTHHHFSFLDPSEKGYFNNQKIRRHEASSHLFDRGFVSAGNGLVLGLVNEDVCWRSCRDEHPRAERGSCPGQAPAPPGAVTLATAPASLSLAADPWIECAPYANVFVSFLPWLYLLAADWHERASGSPDPADRCSRGSAAPAAAAGTEP